MRYAAGRLWEEVAYLAYYLHWSLEEILDLPHPVRDLMIGEVGKIHNQLSGETGADVDQPRPWAG
ncbi:MAG TPA: DUF6760 family protein [Streptosporangiaceae bacterium]|jgi:hypothetical protein|nr:DUF6760 family protein [Streptosporangiaceae bacterium]